MKTKFLVVIASSLLALPIYSNAGYVEQSPPESVPQGYAQAGYPTMAVIPDSPVYYAPSASLNLFFYDGVYWSFFDDGWYMSSWYAGPWYPVDPMYIPYYILNIPIRYYVRPPLYFQAWRIDEHPHWEERWHQEWGGHWEEKRRDLQSWHPAPEMRPAPLPHYQQNYNNNYPQHLEEQHTLHQNNYNYQPKEPVVQQHFSQPPTTPPVRAPQSQMPPRNNPGEHPEHHEGGGDHH